MVRVLVTGAAGSAGCNFIRALKMTGGYHVVGTDCNQSMASLSNADKLYIVPRIESDYLETYIPRMNAIIKEERIDFLHPQPDVEVSVIGQNRELFKATTFLPSKQALSTCRDKYSTYLVLSRHGVPAPPTFLMKTELDVAPALLEVGHQGWLRKRTGAGGKGQLPVICNRHVIAWIDYWQTMENSGWGEFILSERLIGKEYAWQSVWRNGSLVISQARERVAYILAHSSPSGQTSSPSIARTVNNHEVNAVGYAAVKAVDPNANGVFCIDMKENDDGVPCVTEINAGRFFTTSDFFAEAGCNMPDAYVKMALGEEVSFPSNYNPLPEGMTWLRNVDMGKLLVR